jgi:hypothetical protein
VFWPGPYRTQSLHDAGSLAATRIILRTTTVSGPGRRTVCRKTTSSEQHAREFARASGRLAKTAAIDAAKDCSGPRYRNEIVALQLRMLGNSVNGTAPKTEASEKVPF